MLIFYLELNILNKFSIEHVKNDKLPNTLVTTYKCTH